MMDSDETFSSTLETSEDDSQMEIDVMKEEDEEIVSEDHAYEVLTTEKVVEHMVDSIKEVMDTLVEVSQQKLKINFTVCTSPHNAYKDFILLFSR